MSLRILHIIPGLDPGSGGPALALKGMVKAQKDIGLKPVVYTALEENANRLYIDELQAMSIEVALCEPVTGPLKRHQEIHPMAMRLMKKSDVAHLHGLWEEVLYAGAKAARKHKIPYIIRPCGMLDPWSLTQGRLKKRLYYFFRLRKMLEDAQGIHYTSGIEREKTEQLSFKTPGFVVPNGLDWEEYRHLPKRGWLRQSLGIRDNQLILLFLGRLHEKKGVHRLITAFQELNDTGVSLVIVGEGESSYTQRLRHMVRSGSGSDRIYFTGQKTGADKLAAIVDSDLFVLPSAQENFGIAVAEAMACGVPVLISDQVNIHGEISKAGAGEVFPLTNRALVNTLRRWVNDPARRLRARENARDFARQYDWRRMVVRLSKIYERITGR